MYSGRSRKAFPFANKAARSTTKNAFEIIKGGASSTIDAQMNPLAHLPRKASSKPMGIETSWLEGSLASSPRLNVRLAGRSRISTLSPRPFR